MAGAIPLGSWADGRESIHAHINRLEATYAGIPNKLDRLKYIFKMYHIETPPSLLSLKTRKRTERNILVS